MISSSAMASEKILLSLFLVSVFVLEPKFSFPVGDDDADADASLNEVDSVFNETKFLELELFEEENNGETMNTTHTNYSNSPNHHFDSD